MSNKRELKEVKVSFDNHKELLKIKVENDLKNLDGAISLLLGHYGKYKKENKQ